MVIDTSNQSFDMQDIENRRFMYHPKTCTLILGDQHSKRNLISGSHAEEHGKTSVKIPFDEFIRGWIGTGGNYNDGVIHFAPDISHLHPKEFEKGYDTLTMFRDNNANGKTVVRGFGKLWEQPLAQVMEVGRLPLDAGKPSIHEQLKTVQPMQVAPAEKSYRSTIER